MPTSVGMTVRSAWGHGAMRRLGRGGGAAVDGVHQFRWGWAEVEGLWQAAEDTDARGVRGVDDRVLLRLGDRGGGGLFGRLLRRRWRRFRHGRGWRGAQCVGHQPDGTVLGPGGAVGGGMVRLTRTALGLHTQQQLPRRARLPHHADGPGVAFQEERVICGGVFAGYPQAVHRGGVGGNVLDSEVGLVGIDREQRGHVGDGGVVAAGEVLRCVGDRRRERAAAGVDELVVGVPGELEDGV
jgi:hypothetical protein